MAICPSCGAELKDDSVMAQCPKCGEFSFIDMDGVAHLSAADSAVDVPPAAAPAFTEQTKSVIRPDIQEYAEEEKTEAEPSREADNSFQFGMEPMQGPAAEPEVMSQFEPTQDPPVDVDQNANQMGGQIAGELDMDAFISGEQYEQEPEPVQFGQPGDALGLNDFANSETSQAKDGPLLFKILISGIDTKEMRESLREAIEDSRFGWDSNALMASIRGGKLQIDGVAPVKASILVNRIKRLDLEIRWEQYDIKQMDAP